MPNRLPGFDDFSRHCQESDRLMLDTQRGDLYEALRLLGIATAHAARYGEALPVAELVERIKTADVDPAADAIVTEGMTHLLEVLRYARRGPRESDVGTAPADDSARTNFATWLHSV